MGMAYVTWIYDDGIRDAARSTATWEQVRQATGEALLKLCLQPDREFDSRTNRTIRVTAHAVGNMGNCVNFVDEVHSTDERVYLWARNCLRPLNRLNDEELRLAATIIADEQAVRRQAPA